MPYKTIWIPPAIALHHEGVTVYHSYKDNDLGCGAYDSWFTLDREHAEDTEFSLPELARRLGMDPGLIIPVLKAAIDKGLLKNQAAEEDPDDAIHDRTQALLALLEEVVDDYLAGETPGAAEEIRMRLTEQVRFWDKS
jgi:hypothetical protein